MLIQNVHVKNFRSILDESLPCDSLTALVGRNGSGKSSFLMALELFYNPTARVASEDFYDEDVTQDIELAVTYSDLNEEARDLFSAYIDDNTLTVVRVFPDPKFGKAGTYHGMRLQNPEFVDVRNAGGASAVRSKYSEIRKKTIYKSLPTAGSADAARKQLADWETENPDKCRPMRDDGQFFGFTQVGQGYLGRYTKFIHVPAVRDATEDATERRGSSVTEIMDLVVRSALARREDVQDFEQRTQCQYQEVMNPTNLTELGTLADDLSETLRSYVPDSKVRLQWSDLSDISIPPPQAEVKLLEDEYESRVERTGHGLQRAFIITMLQHLNAVRYHEPESENGASEGTKSDSGVVTPQLPSLVLAIEEPELYQHPSRQRHLASVLLKLATGAIPGVADRTQVIYTTHSPLLVGLDRFDQIRVLRKVSQDDDRPKTTRLKTTDLEAVANELWLASDQQGEKFTADTLRPRLRSLMTPWMGEGFFADVVVLVEGEGDRAAILGLAKSRELDLDSQGITVIPCSGKPNLDRPLVIFRQLGIAVYVVWDGDRGRSRAKPEVNRKLLRLLDMPDESWPCFVGDSAACFKVELEKTLKEEIGREAFEQWSFESKELLDIDNNKSPAVIEHVIIKAASDHKTSKSLEDIFERIIALKTQTSAP